MKSFVLAMHTGHASSDDGLGGVGFSGPSLLLFWIIGRAMMTEKRYAHSDSDAALRK